MNRAVYSSWVCQLIHAWNFNLLICHKCRTLSSIHTFSILLCPQPLVYNVDNWGTGFVFSFPILNYNIQMILSSKCKCSILKQWDKVFIYNESPAISMMCGLYIGFSIYMNFHSVGINSSDLLGCGLERVLWCLTPESIRSFSHYDVWGSSFF